MHCEYCGSVLSEIGEHTTKWHQSWNVGGKLIRCRLYRVWCSMRNRCRNPGNQKWSRYGARGIRVCDDWQDFANFRNWSVANGYGPNLSIDRIDNDGNYEPTNCQWIPLTENKAKLTPEQVLEVLESDETCASLGEKYGVHNSVISNIRIGRTRSDITGITYDRSV